jgi:hypothetical protein
MSYRDTLSIKIKERIAALRARGEIVAPNWVAHDICVEHKAGLVSDEGDDTDFYQWCAYTATRDLVRREINGLGDQKEWEYQPAQIVLPGFEREHIQDYYVVKRDNDDVMVPITGMSDAEVKAKIALYRSMAIGNTAHANELDRFLVWRAERQSSEAA